MTNNDQSHAGWSQVIVVLLLATGAVLLQFPIEANRPAPSGQGIHSSGIQDVDARLWQDPFEAIDKAAQKPAASPVCAKLTASGMAVTIQPGACAANRDHDLDWLRQQIQTRQPGGALPTVMLAMMPGGNWVGADEARRRIRYAVLAGLNAEGYVPDDPEHIGHVKGDVAPLPPLTIPFEWLEREKASLLLIWLDDEALLRDAWVGNCGVAHPPCEGKQGARAAPRPLHQLAAIVEKLGGRDKPGNPGLLLIGPTSSTFLTLAARETDIEPSMNRLARHVLRWHSPFATLPDDRIQPGGPDKGKDFLKRLVRFTPTDDKLAAALVQELRLRQFGSSQAVALVGQWDTAYSRTLRDLLRDGICQASTTNENDANVCKGVTAPARDDTSKAPQPMRVLEESYLRGLDGKLPEQKEVDKKKDGKEKTPIEPNDGEGQIDYLRRLSWKLKQREKEVERIGAIGVLGNDYYDKLLVLKALRPAFPDTVFFTTEVDAAMLGREDNKPMRNLVVASGYGLSLAPAMQKDIPPFRDSGQTAAYLATRQALNPTPALDTLVRDIQERAQIFEVGRSEVIQLPLMPPSRLGGSQPGESNGPGALKFVALPLALLLVTWFISATTGFTHRQHRCAWGTILLGTGIVAFALFKVSQRGEPLYWLEGISIWPSEVVRLIALALAMTLFWEGIKRIRRTRAYLNHEFFAIENRKTEKVTSLCTHMHFLLAPPHRLLRMRRWLIAQLTRAWRRWRECRQNRQFIFPTTQEQNAGEIWSIYNGDTVCAGAPRPLRLPFWISVLAFVLAYFCLGLILSQMGLPRPKAPARGDLAFRMDTIVIVSTVVAHLALLFLAMYEGFRAVWLARALQGPTRWPDEAIQRFWPVSRGKSINYRLFDPWFDVRFIAHATAPVQRIIFYPFIVLSLLMLSRSSAFDRWGTPAFLIAIYATSIVLVVIAALRMRYSAEKVRQISIKDLSTRRLELQARGREELVRQIDTMLRDIQEIKTGTFAPLSQQPLIKAILTLAGSLSGIALLESVNQMNL